MKESSAPPQRLLMLGPEQGWHASELKRAAQRLGHELNTACYESVSAAVAEDHPISLGCSAGRLSGYDAILTRTMPAASMERLTFRLSVLHAIADRLSSCKTAMVNRPRSLEWSIDKFASLARLAAAGFATPPTRFVQTRREAMDAFVDLGGDCIVKPIFGGEGRGVMRISDRELAWTTFSTLDQLDAVLQIQAFIPPGGEDMRFLVIGDRVIGFRRQNRQSFRTNIAAGAVCRPLDLDRSDDSELKRLQADALRVSRLFGLTFASVDVIENDHGPPMFLEVNAIPGWKGAQQVCEESIAELVVRAVVKEAQEIES